MASRKRDAIQTDEGKHFLCQSSGWKLLRGEALRTCEGARGSTPCIVEPFGRSLVPSLGADCIMPLLRPSLSVSAVTGGGPVWSQDGLDDVLNEVQE